MNRFQNIKFSSVDDFLEYLPEEELEIVEFIRQLIGSCMPYYKEKLAYNVPFYYGKKRILFIWPSSVPWAKVEAGGVMLGFCKGYLIPDDIGYLEKGNRKEIYTKTFFSVKEIDVDLLKAYIYSAIDIDQSFS
ncbi:DUF1801 domain-containing protein [Labilibacter sediminis]|nr:DUF1801 domain-containing protein [Labilibacter sediminis]